MHIRKIAGICTLTICVMGFHGSDANALGGFDISKENRQSAHIIKTEGGLFGLFRKRDNSSASGGGQIFVEPETGGGSPTRNYGNAPRESANQSEIKYTDPAAEALKRQERANQQVGETLKWLEQKKQENAIRNAQIEEQQRREAGGLPPNPYGNPTAGIGAGAGQSTDGRVQVYRPSRAGEGDAPPRLFNNVR